jgi:uncharacterized protein YbjT (DUF2867 family)
VKLVIFGATRGIGLQVVRAAVATGHDVRAFARDPAPLAGMKLEIAAGDVLKPETVGPAVDGVDAVVSALGQGTSNRPTTHMSQGTAAILEAMRTHGVKRGVFVTSLGACDDPDEPFLFRVIGRRLYGNIFADHRRLEERVRASGCDWTLVRPGSLTDRPRSGTYRVARDRRPPGGNTIARADVADFILEELTAGAYVHSAACLGY